MQSIHTTPKMHISLISTLFLVTAGYGSLAAFKPSNAPLDVERSQRAFDYVIVGGGLAGLTLASRLSEDSKISVAVIEAGGFYEQLDGNVSEIPAEDISWTSKNISDVNPLLDWGFKTTPQPGAFNQVIHYARGKALGGSTARNYMAYNWGTIGTYQKWADEVGDQSYTFDNILPYFKKSLNFTPPDISKRGVNATPSYDASTLAQGGPLDITFSKYAQAINTWVQKGMQAVGILPQNGFTSGTLNGSSWVIATINHTLGIRESSETAFLRPALSRPNLHIFNESLAKRILFDGKVAKGIYFNQSGQLSSIMAKQEVVISCGTFQSPQLLMVSGIGPAATLGKFDIPIVANRSGVGQNMWDQILFGPSYRVNVQTASALAMGDNLALANKEFIDKQDGPLASPGGDFLAYEKIPQSLRRNFSEQAVRDLETFPLDWPVS
jgi:choline dehydrogenase